MIDLKKILEEVFNTNYVINITENVMQSLLYTIQLLSSSNKPIQIKNLIIENMQKNYEQYYYKIDVFKFYVLSKKI